MNVDIENEFPSFLNKELPITATQIKLHCVHDKLEYKYKTYLYCV